MNLIHFKKKNSIPVHRKDALSLPVNGLKAEMDRLFDRFFHNSLLDSDGWAEEFEQPLGNFLPKVDLSDNIDKVVIRAEAPGISPEDIDISISGNVLTIRGEKKESTEEEREDFYHCERRFGTFTRSIELPSTADLDSIEATQNDGVLTVEVQKLPMAHPKRIEVKSPKRELTSSRT
jgi:HSP20 family protein